MPPASDAERKDGEVRFAAGGLHLTSDFVPDALFFDMDGLLLDTERAGSIAFCEITAPFGIAAERAEIFYAELVGTSSAITRRRVSEFIPGVDIETFVGEWHQALDRQMAGEVLVKPTVRETLDAVAVLGHRLAVVTSTRGPRAREHLERAGLLKHFETIVAGDEVKANKPDPEPYLEAARRLGVDPARSAAFEDSDHGVTAAVAAGCLTVQIPDIRPADRPLPVLGQRISRDLSEAMKALRILI